MTNFVITLKSDSGADQMFTFTGDATLDHIFSEVEQRNRNRSGGFFSAAYDLKERIFSVIVSRDQAVEKVPTMHDYLDKMSARRADIEAGANAET